MNKKVNLIALICYAILLIATIALTVTMIVTYFQNKDGGNLGTGLTAAFAIIIGIISGFYAIIAAIPTVFKICAIMSERKVFTALCIPFDVILAVFNAAILISLLSEPEPISLIIFISALLISLLSLVINIITLKKNQIGE